MGRILAIAIWLIAIGVIIFLARAPWLPEAITAHAGALDRQIKITFLVIGAGFLLAQAALGVVVWRFGAQGKERATYLRNHPRLELVWTAATALVFIALAITGQVVWAQLRLNQAPPDAVQVEVTAQQFQWHFRYPGADGRWGSTDPHLYNDADNSIGARPGPLGIDPRDPAGKDDIVTNVLVVPVNRPIKVTLRAKDVIHDFYVPALRLKQDAVPGMPINIHFTATKAGRYEIACAELCGQLHHQMRAYLEVRTPEEFAQWLQAKAPQ